MAGTKVQESQESGTNRAFAVGVARAAAGAILFSLPLLMTMEMWQLGMHIDPWRLMLFLLIAIPLLVALSHVVGFERTFDWRSDVMDAFVALLVSFFTSSIILGLLSILGQGMSATEFIGKIELQMIPGSIGALLARSELGLERKEDTEEEERQSSYLGEIFLMTVGGLYLSFSIAPTEEIILIAYRMTAWHALATILTSLLLMHAFVYAVEFKGSESSPERSSRWQVFLCFTAVGYVCAFFVSLYSLWTFGRTDGLGLREIVMIGTVLAFPASIGSAAARLII